MGRPRCLTDVWRHISVVSPLNVQSSGVSDYLGLNIVIIQAFMWQQAPRRLKWFTVAALHP